MDQDGRIELRIVAHGSERPDPCAVLIQSGDVAPSATDGWLLVRWVAGPDAGPAHAVFCACPGCATRGQLPTLLGALFTQRATGAVAYFRAMVLSVPPGQVDVLGAGLLEDRLVAARYRVCK